MGASPSPDKHQLFSALQGDGLQAPGTGGQFLCGSSSQYRSERGTKVFMKRK